MSRKDPIFVKSNPSNAEPISPIPSNMVPKPSGIVTPNFSSIVDTSLPIFDIAVKPLPTDLIEDCAVFCASDKSFVDFAALSSISPNVFSSPVTGSYTFSARISAFSPADEAFWYLFQRLPPPTR